MTTINGLIISEELADKLKEFCPVNDNSRKDTILYSCAEKLHEVQNYITRLLIDTTEDPAKISDMLVALMIAQDELKEINEVLPTYPI